MISSKSKRTSWVSRSTQVEHQALSTKLQSECNLFVHQERKTVTKWLWRKNGIKFKKGDNGVREVCECACERQTAINTASGGHRWQASRLLWLNVELNNWRLPCRLVELVLRRYFVTLSACPSVILRLLPHLHFYTGHCVLC